MYRLVAYITPRGVTEYQEQVERIADGALIPFDQFLEHYMEILLVATVCFKDF